MDDDQGLRLTFAFNHEEAQRSFEAAAARDPSCAVCYWGAALVLGGADENGPLASAEVMEITDRQIRAYGSLTQARTAATANLLPSGNVWIAGGPLCQRDVRQAPPDMFVPMGGEWSTERAEALSRSES